MFWLRISRIRQGNLLFWNFDIWCKGDKETFIDKKEHLDKLIKNGIGAVFEERYSIGDSMKKILK